MANTATRLITLLMLLQRQPNQKAADLAHQLGVSVRSLHRYMTLLDEMGIPVYSERGPYGGFSLVRGYKMPPLVFTPEEAVAIYLGTGLVREMWGKLYQEAAQGAMAKLENVLPEEQRHEIAWARRTLVATDMHRAQLDTLSPLLEKVRRAAREQRRVVLIYRGRGQPESQPREVDPYAVVHRWGWWYVLGHCHLRNDIRFFRLDRIVELTLLEQTFQVPADFKIEEQLAKEFQPPSQVQVRVRFTPEMALEARDNRMIWDTFEEQRDGSIITGLATPDLMWAASMILSFGPGVVVLEPKELRQMLADWAQGIAANYTEVKP